MATANGTLSSQNYLDIVFIFSQGIPKSDFIATISLACILTGLIFPSFKIAVRSFSSVDFMKAAAWHVLPRAPPDRVSNCSCSLLFLSCNVRLQADSLLFLATGVDTKAKG